MKKIKVTSFTLHLLAMSLMLCDHLWATVVPGNQWMTDLGRLAFPLFAFLLVEGFFHTHSRKRYALRLLVFALLSEVPFDLMYGGSVFYPFHQNVLWTFLLAMGCMALVERGRADGRLWMTALVSLLVAAGGFALGTLLMVDYFGCGVLTVLVFYFFRGRRWYHFVGQFLGLFYINWVLFAGLEYPLTLFGASFALPQQGLAVLALLPIWLYRGEQGPYNRAIKYLYYGFYPVHIVVLAAIFSVI